MLRPWFTDLPGRQFDRESGNYYDRNRQYMPSTGRFMQRDPIGLQVGITTFIGTSTTTRLSMLTPPA